jgi:membrane-associated phospholipid phosphatase
MMYAETMALAIILPALGKSAAERNRPYVYNPDAPLDEKLKRDARSSFFSRHTSMAFASGVFLSTVYNDYYPHSRSKSRILAGSLLGATAVGVMRYESGMHFPSDIIAGAIVGSVIGYAVPRLHRVNNERVDVVPYWTGSEYGVALRFLIP